MIRKLYKKSHKYHDVSSQDRRVGWHQEKGVKAHTHQRKEQAIPSRKQKP
jgi:hypothetical protein